MHPFVKGLLTTAIAAAIFVINGAIFWSTDSRFLMGMALFGAFVGVIALPEFDKRFRKGADLRNVVAGVAAGAGLAVLQSMPLGYTAGMILGGALLGYLGLRWVRHLHLP